MNIQLDSYISLLPEDVKIKIVRFFNPAISAQLCTLERRIALSDSTSLLWFKKLKNKFGLNSAVKKLKNKTTDEEKVDFLFSHIYSRASSVCKNLPLQTILPKNFVTADVLFAKEEAENLNIICKDLVLQMPGLDKIMQSSEFLEKTSLKKRIYLKNYLKNNKEECNKVKQLTCTTKNLTLIPKELKFFNNLSFLDLSINSIKFLSPKLNYCWSNLKELKLAFNQISHISKRFGLAWSSLDKISLSGNKIELLPGDFGKTWINLTALDLSTNKIINLPSSFGESWNSIESVTLSYNNIQKIDSAFGSNWKKLMFLSLRIEHSNFLTEHKQKWPQFTLLT